MHKYTLAILFVLVIATGCSTSGTIDEKSIFDEEGNEIITDEPSTLVESKAYAKGVEDTMADFKSKFQATKRFVYEPAIVECGVEMPAEVINGMLKPRREECIQIRPGGFIENGNVVYPNLDR